MSTHYGEAILMNTHNMYVLRGEEILMSTHNVYFYGEFSSNRLATLSVTLAPLTKILGSGRTYTLFVH